jgi:hypothetical protein
MYLASDRYFHIGLVSSMWKSSIMPLRTLNSFDKVIIRVNDLLINVSFVIPILWITKEIMSRGPQVADMEC